MAKSKSTIPKIIYYCWFGRAKKTKDSNKMYKLMEKILSRI